MIHSKADHSDPDNAIILVLYNIIMKNQEPVLGNDNDGTSVTTVLWLDTVYHIFYNFIAFI